MELIFETKRKQVEELLCQIIINFQFFDMIRSAEEVIENEEVGHLMRTKFLGVNEGGVNTGYSCLDTPFLIEWDCQPITYMYMCIR